MPSFLHLIEIALLVLVINIPFGYWRGNTRRLSLQWILAIHIPVPLIIVIRLLSDVGFHLITYPVFIIAYFSGQYFGGLIHRHLKQKQIVGSCIVMDLYRHFK